MIICNSNNFVVTRAPKVGGLSMEMYIHKSGLIDPNVDTYSIDGGLASWEELEAYSEANANLKYEGLPNNLYGYSAESQIHSAFSELVEAGEIPTDMPCIGCVRHPVEWLSEPNDSWDAFLGDPNSLLYNDPTTEQARIPQTYYYPDHAQLFNKENLHEHVNAFIAEKGGTTSDKIVMRDSNTAEAISYYLNNLSEDRKQKTLEIYEKDFIAWEKAYAVYN